MKEFMPRPIQTEVSMVVRSEPVRTGLTRPTSLPRLDRGDIFMADTEPRGPIPIRPAARGGGGGSPRDGGRGSGRGGGRPPSRGGRGGRGGDGRGGRGSDRPSNVIDFNQARRNREGRSPDTSVDQNNIRVVLEGIELQNIRNPQLLTIVQEAQGLANSGRLTGRELREYIRQVEEIAADERVAADQRLQAAVALGRLNSAQNLADHYGNGGNGGAGGSGNGGEGGNGGGRRPPAGAGGGEGGGGDDGNSDLPPSGEFEEQGRRERTPEQEEVEAVYTEYRTATGDEKLALEKKLIELLNEAIDGAPPMEAQSFPGWIISYGSLFKEIRERLLNMVIFKPYEDPTETNDYHSVENNIYAGPRVETLLTAIRRREIDENGNIDLEKGEERYKYYLAMKTAAMYFHVMNKLVLQGNLEGFIRTAESINVQHFEAMTRIRGVPEVMRLYEQKYQEILARDKRISTDGYKEIRTEVEHLFKDLNAAGLIKSEYTDKRAEGEELSNSHWKMEDWEQEQAINVGRAFFNMTFRAAELIASGQVPEGENKGYKQYGSFPQENAVRLMNWMRWLGYRFEVGGKIEEGGRGGREFYERVMKNYKELLHAKKKHLNINKIVQFGGQKVDDIEQGAMFGISGVYSGWRMENLTFNAIKISGGVTLRKWLDTETPVEEEMGGVSRIFQKGEHKGKVMSRSAYIGALKETKNREVVADFLEPVINNARVGMGVLLKNGMFDGEAAYEARKKLWEKVAEQNVPLMVNYLTELTFEEGSEGLIESLDSILQRHGIQRFGTDGKETEAWKTLRKNLLLDQQYNVRRATDRRNVEGIERPMLSESEEAIKSEVVREGKKLAPHLADVVFPYLPFMNDVPFENLDYNGPGEDFFRRRTAGDFGGFYSAEQAFGKIMGNPAGMNVEKALESFAGVVSGIESPNGPKDAHEKVYPMFAAWVDIVMAKPGLRQLFVKQAMAELYKPTSIAQEWQGVDALSLNEAEMLAILHEAHKMGLLDHELVEELRKEKKLTLFYLFWMMMRDFFLYAPAIIIAKEFVEETAEGVVPKAA